MLQMIQFIHYTLSKTDDDRLARHIDYIYRRQLALLLT